MVPGFPFLYRAFQEADLKELVPLVALAAQMWMRAHPGFLSPAPPLLYHERRSVRPVFPLVSHIPRGSSQVSGLPRTPKIQFKLQTVAVTLHGPGSYRLSPSHQELPTQTPFSAGPSRSLSSGLPRPGSWFLCPSSELSQSPWPLTVALMSQSSSGPCAGPGRFLGSFPEDHGWAESVGGRKHKSDCLYFFLIIVSIYFGCAGSSCCRAFPAAAMAEALLARCLGPWA